VVLAEAGVALAVPGVVLAATDGRGAAPGAELHAASAHRQIVAADAARYLRVMVVPLLILISPG
jgi:hypothetical protein